MPVSLRPGHISPYSVKVNPHFISLLKPDERTALAVFFLIKRKFKNSRIYNYNPTLLSKHLGISRYQVHKSIETILRKQWGFFNESRREIKLKRTSSLMYYHRKMKDVPRGWNFARSKLCLNDTDSFQDILDKIDLCVIGFHMAKQNSIIKERDKDPGKTKKVVGQAHGQTTEGGPKTNKECVNAVYNNFCVIGMRKLGRELGCSKESASQLIKRLKSKGLINTKKMVKRIVDVRTKQPMKFKSKQELLAWVKHKEGKVKNFSIGYYFINHKTGIAFHYIGTSIRIN